MKIARFAVLVLSAASLAWSQARVSGQVGIQHVPGSKGDNAGAVVWLTSAAAPPPIAPAQPFRMAQRGKKYEPHLLVIPVGSTVAFPNFDPFFHNVFSLGDNRPFDLGLYQAGSSRSRAFDRPGISYVFCNIHPQMSAVIVTVPSRWYATSDASGRFELAAVPPGQYQLHVWYERGRPDDLARLTRTLAVEGDVALDPVTIAEVAAPATHKNKYGQDYETAKGYGGGGVR